jgi:hypothetical protein
MMQNNRIPPQNIFINLVELNNEGNASILLADSNSPSVSKIRRGGEVCTKGVKVVFPTLSFPLLCHPRIILAGISTNKRNQRAIPA